jgi:succinyl-CoA synthetase beta subunit
VKLLTGFRGAPPADIDALARTISALSHFIADHGDRILEVEINPLAVMKDKGGCVALDCVLVATK